MEREEMLKMLESLKELSSKYEALLFDFQKNLDNSEKKSHLLSEIEVLSSHQTALMDKLVSLCDNKELVGKIKNILNERQNLFISFGETSCEKELKELENKISKNTDSWIETFQHILTELFEVRQNS